MWKIKTACTFFLQDGNAQHAHLAKPPESRPSLTLARAKRTSYASRETGSALVWVIWRPRVRCALIGNRRGAWRRVSGSGELAGEADSGGVPVLGGRTISTSESFPSLLGTQHACMYMYCTSIQSTLYMRIHTIISRSMIMSKSMTNVWYKYLWDWDYFVPFRKSPQKGSSGSRSRGQYAMHACLHTHTYTCTCTLVFCLPALDEKLWKLWSVVNLVKKTQYSGYSCTCVHSMLHALACICNMMWL